MNRWLMGVHHCVDGMCVEMHDLLRNAMVGSCQLSKIPISLYDGSVSRMTLNLTQAGHGEAKHECLSAARRIPEGNLPKKIKRLLTKNEKQERCNRIFRCREQWEGRVKTFGANFLRPLWEVGAATRPHGTGSGAAVVFIPIRPSLSGALQILSQVQHQMHLWYPLVSFARVDPQKRRAAQPREEPIARPRAASLSECSWRAGHTVHGR